MSQYRALRAVCRICITVATFAMAVVFYTHADTTDITISENTAPEIREKYNALQTAREKRASLYDNYTAALSDNAQKMHENETSTVNKTIGAAGMGVTGAGGMMLAQSLSETMSDANAERTMAAYLQTFKCEYGAGTQIRGGETNVELPGGNDMIPLYTEYATLANDLKTRKEALGIRPGIESEVIIDKSETGLYDDVGTGITGGGYASIARALQDPEGEDAAKWAAQKETTKNTLIAGAVTAGVGAVGSLAANIAVNHNVKNEASEIVKKYEKYKAPFKQAEDKINKNTPKDCAALFDNDSQVTGTYPNCSCKEETYYFKFEEGCIPCTGDLKVNSDKTGCECKEPGYVQVSGTNRCEQATSTCTITHYKKPEVCECIDEATPTTDGDCRCDESKGYVADGNNGCKKEEKPDAPTEQPGQRVLSLNLKASALFKSGYANLKDNDTKETIEREVTKAINEAQTQAQNESKELADLKTSDDYCLWVVGKTDHQGFLKSCQQDPSKGKYCDNTTLSEARAKTITNVLEQTGQFNVKNIRSYGIADEDCPAAQKRPPEANEKCRVVEVVLLHGSCDKIKQSSKLNDIIKQSGVVSTAIDKLTETITK